MTEFEQLIHMHAAASLEKQLRLGALVGDAEWELDAGAGQLVFEDAGGAVVLRCDVQLLGTEGGGTWLWAWANPMKQWPDTRLRAARSLCALGEQTGARPLSSPSVALKELNPGHLALVASGACRASGFFRCPLPNGSVYCLITSPALPPPELPPAHQVADVFPRLLELLELGDQRLAFLHYLAFHRLRIVEEPRRVVGTGSHGDQVIATFDGNRRLVELRAAAIT